MAAPTRTLLLGSRKRLLTGDWCDRAPALAALLARGKPFDAGASDEPALERVLRLSGDPRDWPVAALTRSVDCGDAGSTTWLRADPAFVRADAACARLLAVGDFEVGRADAEAAMILLAPLFGDEGLVLDAPHPSRWYLQTGSGFELPRFPHPRLVLGDDLSLHLPRGPEARRWLRLLNESQVLLHHAGFNRARVARGLPPINSLWFWGGGPMPARVECHATRVASNDPIVLGALRHAGIAAVDYAAAAPAEPGGSVVDLRMLDDVATLDRDWLVADLSTLKHGRFGRVELLFSDGSGVSATPSLAWRIWRRRPL